MQMKCRFSCAHFFRNASAVLSANAACARRALSLRARWILKRSVTKKAAPQPLAASTASHGSRAPTTPGVGVGLRAVMKQKSGVLLRDATFFEAEAVAR
jgi:hypothetical protein